MLKLLAKAAATVAAIGLIPSIAVAHSSKPHPFKDASITFVSESGGRAGPGDHRPAEAATLIVEHNGAEYTGLAGNVTAVFRLKAKVKLRHRIYDWVVTTGDPANENLLPEHVIGASGSTKTRKLDITTTFSMDAVQAVSRGIGTTRAKEIVDRCNAAFSNLPAQDEIIDQIQLTIHAGFAAGKRSRLRQAGASWFSNSGGRPGIAHTTFPVNIVCAGNQEDRSADVTPPRAPNELYSIDLKVVQHGDRCPKDVTVSAYADYRWQATSFMRMRVKGGTPKMRVAKTKQKTFAGKTFHRAEAQFKYKLDPGQRSFTLTVDGKNKTHTETMEIKCPPFSVVSAWLDYKVEDTPDCPKKVMETATFYTTRPGWVNHEIRMKGGLVVSSGKLTSKRKGDRYAATAVRKLTMEAIDTEFMADAIDYSANSGWVPLQLECLDLSGEIAVADSAQLPKNRCPRQGQAVFKVHSNMNSPINYRVDCTGGRSWQGTMQMSPKGPEDFQGVMAKTFDVAKTGMVSCVLKRVKGNNHFVLGFGGHQFSCANPAIRPASTGFAPEPRNDPNHHYHAEVATPAPPRNSPSVTVTPVPERPQRTGHSDLDSGSASILDCVGGRLLKDGTCVCRPGWTVDMERKLDHGIWVSFRRCIPGSSDDKTLGEDDAENRFDNTLKVAKERAEAARRRKAKIAAQKTAERKRLNAAGRKIRLLKLRRSKAERAARTRANSRRLRALRSRRIRTGAQTAVESKRLKAAARNARLLKLKRSQTKRAARSRANSRLLRSLNSKRLRKRAARRRGSTSSLPSINRRMMHGR